MDGFDVGAKARLATTHPLLQKLMNEARKKSDFTIADSMRGRKAQMAAIKGGFSHVKFGNSAHNWTPALALDLYPLPFSVLNTRANLQRFVDLQLKIILPTARMLGIPIRQGVDFNMNGILTDDKWDDLPHVELHPWREFAKKARLFEG